MLDSLAQRLGCSRAEALAVAVLVAGALAVLALLAARSNREPAPDRPVLAPVEEDVVVHVAGEVAAPGVYTLTAGARVADAIAAAGGALPGAAVDRVNLARELEDGEQILLAAPAGGEDDPAAPEPASAWRADGRLDLNRATAADLEQLPGIGPVMAQRIIEHRDAIGRFSSVGDLRGVSGIGEKRLQALAELVDV